MRCGSFTPPLKPPDHRNAPSQATTRHMSGFLLLGRDRNLSLVRSLQPVAAS